MNRPLTPPPPKSPLPIVLAVAAVAVAVAAWFLWPRSVPQIGLPPPPTAQAPEAPASTPAPAPAPPAAASAPSVQYPIEAAPATAAEMPEPLPPLGQSDDRLQRALVALLGRNPVLTWLQTDGFVGRFVATVDNLGRAHVPPRLWPVNPIPGRFSVSGGGDDARLSLDNARRYENFVVFASSVDAARAASLYKAMYPLFQEAYEQLGYPGQHFNDRLVAVIDLLLATPQPPEPPRVVLTQVKGPVPTTQPWSRYEFADATLEARPAGQKILLRLNPSQQQRLRAQLVAFRAQIAAANPAPPAAAPAR